MKWDWSGRISSVELQVAKEAMLTNKVAGELLPIPRWRYSVLGSILYTLARSIGYCIRHPLETTAIEFNEALPTYIYFAPTCRNAVLQVESRFPGNSLGFKGRNCNNFPMRNILVATILSLRSTVILYWIFTDHRWRPWLSDVIFYCLTYRWAKIRFAHTPHLNFIYSGDHCCFDRGIVDASSQLGHTTIYLQHAPITHIFPPLTADYSLLDGASALQTYQAITGSRGTALVCGRQYELVAIRDRRKVSRSVLVCTSPIDNFESWRPIIVAVGKAGYRVALRTHPAERRQDGWRRLTEELQIEWLDPRETELTSALEHCSMVLAGQSGVLLEAALSGAVSVLIQFPEDTSRGLYDYYGFSNMGLALLVDPADISEILEKCNKGEALVATAGVANFDAAYFLNDNMQLIAIEVILKSNSTKADLKAAGFRLVSAPRDSLEVFVPHSLSIEASRVAFPNSKPGHCLSDNDTIE
jgi:hypothetical protein